MTDLKRCSACKQHKPPTEFHLDRRRWDGLQNHCKSCRAARDKRYKKPARQLIIDRMGFFPRGDCEDCAFNVLKVCDKLEVMPCELPDELVSIPLCQLQEGGPGEEYEPIVKGEYLWWK